MIWQRIKWVALLTIAVFALAACGTNATPGGGGGANQTIGSQGEALAFDKTALTAPAGSVQFTFNNTSTAQQHNFVIVRGGEEVAAQVYEAGVAAGPPDYLPADRANIVGATKMLAGRGSETITVELTPGTYTFICTYPGHYAAGMKGTLTVQ